MGSTAGGSRLAAVLAQWLDQIEAAGYIDDARLRSRKLISSKPGPSSASRRDVGQNFAE